MHPDGCPSDAELAAFQLGELSDPRLEAVADHLEGIVGAPFHRIAGLAGKS